MKIKDQNPPLSPLIHNDVLDKICHLVFKYYGDDVEEIELSLDITKSQASIIAIKGMIYEIQKTNGVNE
jgi:hypothetical protein